MAANPDYRIAEGIAYEVLDGEAVVLHLPSGMYYRLNEVATRAFEDIVRSGGTSEARSEILAGYSVDAPDLDADLGRLVTDLVDLGLVIARPE